MSLGGDISQPLSIVLVGIGGYGNHYVNELLDAGRAGFSIAGAVDPCPSSCRRLAELQARHVPLYSSLSQFYEKHHADLAIIATPLHFHAEQTCIALTNSSHVLCEKPLCVTPEQIRQMLRCRDRASKHVAIGYQWSFSRAIQNLKADILRGALGRARRLKSLVLWPRDEAYYRRNRWAGAIRDGAAGAWILDSPVNNACAHYLHNLLYLSGSRVDRSAPVATITAELYRAHPIANYDTAALRCRTADDVEILFIASHATQSRKGPYFFYEFERGTVEFLDRPGATIIVRFADGSTKDYGAPGEPRDRKLWDTIDAIRRGEDSKCGIDAAAVHTQCAWSAQQSMPEIASFPPSLIHVTGESPARKTWIQGLGETLEDCYGRWLLPSELGADWAVAGLEIPVASLAET